MSDLTERQLVLLERMQGLALPEPVPWWPPAPLWWLVVVLAGVALWWMIRHLRAWWRRGDLRRLAMERLSGDMRNWRQSGDTSAYLQSANELLRQLAMALGNRRQVAALSGPEWAAWLAQHSGLTLSDQLTDSLGVSCYRQSPNVVVPELHEELTSVISCLGRQLRNTRLVSVRYRDA